MSAAGARKHWMLFYRTTADYLEKRGEFRGLHLKQAWDAAERGELVLGGAFANPVDGAMLLFRGESADVAEAFARSDPYVLNGLVAEWHVREWTTVVGEGAATPVRPEP